MKHFNVLSTLHDDKPLQCEACTSCACITSIPLSHFMFA